MISIRRQLAQRVIAAMREAGIDGHDPQVCLSQEDQYGDYQSNVAMGLARKLGRKPRDLGGAIIEKLAVDDICEPPELAGPGFINFRIRPAWIARRLETIPAATEAGGDRLGVQAVEAPETVVVDLSSPNLAKEMHIGHFRATVIGDCVARVLEFMGHEVHRENHVGDWGTQFGMLLAHLRREMPEVVSRPERLEISDLESFYVGAKARFDADEDFKKESRETVVALQQGDPVTRRIWRAFCDESLRHCHAIYDRLDVRLIDRGESFYTDWMNEVQKRLEALKAVDPSGPVRESEGALCVFLDGFTTRDGQPLPLIVRKSDGGYNYATSDLATILHRVEELKATRLVYVVGIAQKLHLDMIFRAVRALGWVDERVSLVHLAFGSVLAVTGKPFRTREGTAVKLKDILEEAVQRAAEVVTTQSDEDQGERRLGFSKEQADRIAETVGLAAIRYFDLSHSLSADYRFDCDTMLSLEGNTAPYMLYACARIASIGRKAGVELAALGTDVKIILEHPSEVALARRIAQFAETVEDLSRELRPNLLTDYLFGLAKAFSRFYDKKIGVRVIDAAPQALRLSRLRMCDLTARTLKLGLHLLGIKTLEEM